MIGRLPHLRLSWVALAAIVGMFSVAGEASACGTGGEPETSKACCAGRPTSSCGCCGSSAAGAARAEVARPHEALPAPAGAAVTPPTGACECRPSEPASPSSSSESRTSENRSDHAVGMAAQPTPTARPAALLARRLPPGASHSGAPIYALTSRLRL